MGLLFLDLILPHFFILRSHDCTFSLSQAIELSCFCSVNDFFLILLFSEFSLSLFYLLQVTDIFLFFSFSFMSLIFLFFCLFLLHITNIFFSFFFGSLIYLFFFFFTFSQSQICPLLFLFRPLLFISFLPPPCDLGVTELFSLYLSLFPLGYWCSLPVCFFSSFYLVVTELFFISLYLWAICVPSYNLSLSLFQVTATKFFFLFPSFEQLNFFLSLRPLSFSHSFFSLSLCWILNHSISHVLSLFFFQFILLYFAISSLLYTHTFILLFAYFLSIFPNSSYL
ncbi:unnamed protein product [Acanthosepion pharaonis]|uniref:Uncharacterized protein n=1 Tax=Acanthosepion pharaonis TaxID=158019 RepID=A0A812BSG6_ACAPH|nr:unnamed protein product [Sepia pharaonis]